MNARTLQSLDVATFFDLGARRLEPLCTATGFSARTAELLDLFRDLIDPGGLEPVPQPPLWKSLVVDDHTPFEFSLAIDGAAELRILAEPLGREPSLASNTKTAIELLARLQRKYGIDLSRLERIRDLFLPAELDLEAAFSLWIAASVSATHAPEFKLYLNPEIRGRSYATALTEEMLVRLGFSTAWPLIAETLLRRGPDLDQISYISLDLGHSPEARVKIYAVHRLPSAGDLEVAASAAHAYRPGELTQWLNILAPEVATVFEGRPPQTCYAYVAGRGDRPQSVTTYLPINGYAPHDLAIQQRVLRCLDHFRLPHGPYLAALDAIADRKLDMGVGLQSYISFRRDPGRTRLTVYLPVEVYQPGSIAKLVPHRTPESVQEIVEIYEKQQPITHHPLLRRMRREPANLTHLRQLVANLQVSTQKQEADEEAPAGDQDHGVQQILAEQLGGPHPQGAETAPAPQDRFAQLVKRLDDGPLAAAEPGMLSPGRSLGVRLREMYVSGDTHELAGAAIAADVFGRQLREFVAELVGCQDEDTRGVIKPSRSSASTAAPAARQVATRLPGSVALAWRGSLKLRQGIWMFLDEMYATCYGRPGSIA